MFNFTTLMTNALELGSYDQICTPTNFAQEMLIVQRLGQTIRISDAQKINPAGDDVLANYQPNNSMYGICAREEPSSGGFLSAHTTNFLLVREIPASAPEAGTFFPADGIARIQSSLVFGQSLMAAGRHDHTEDPGPGGKSSWRFTASGGGFIFPFFTLQQIPVENENNIPFANIDIDSDSLVDFEGHPFNKKP